MGDAQPSPALPIRPSPAWASDWIRAMTRRTPAGSPRCRRPVTGPPDPRDRKPCCRPLHGSHEPFSQPQRNPFRKQPRCGKDTVLIKDSTSVSFSAPNPRKTGCRIVACGAAPQFSPPFCLSLPQRAVCTNVHAKLTTATSQRFSFLNFPIFPCTWYLIHYKHA